LSGVFGTPANNTELRDALLNESGKRFPIGIAGGATGVWNQVIDELSAMAPHPDFALFGLKGNEAENRESVGGKEGIAHSPLPPFQM